ncbi:MAG: carboxypeptidase-like regulatory domain-containing protein [Flavobacteriales bacterium]
MRFLALLFFFCTPVALLAQDELSNDVVQFSGLVVTGDSLSPIPFATVYRVRDNRGTVTDTRGFFSIPAIKGDTIRFSSVGYIPTEIYISDTLSSNRYNVVQYLNTDTVQIQTSFIYPWPTKQKFKQELLALDLDADEEERARQNLEAIMLYNRMAELGADGGEAYKASMIQQSQRISYSGQVPPQNIFSPIAWAQFISAWKKGAYKKKN